MKLRRFFGLSLFCIIIGFTAILGKVPVFGDYPPLYTSASILVMDAETGQVLYENDGFSRRYPASITKVMTALLVLEHVEDLTQKLTFSATAVDIPYYASRMWVVEGESITVLEALYGNMLPSGNEVSRALAEFVSGSVPEFVALMNRRAVELGAFNTNFVNPCGLPGDGQYVTAYDMALIMREAIRHPLFVEIISTPYFDIAPTNYNEEIREIRNTNRMVRPTMPEFNEHVIGGKTGFTNAARHTLVTYARRGDFSFIISALYAPHWRYTYADTSALIDLAYNLINEAIALNESAEEYEEYDTQAEDIAETPEPSGDESHKIPTLAPMYPQYIAENHEISTTEAIAVASMSLGVVAVAFFLIWQLSKKQKGR